jgi:lipopolysaccharide transport system permease protein
MNRAVDLAPAPTLVITAERSTAHYWAEMWRFRELLLLLVWRDILVRYKQTVFGIAWAVIRPFVTMVVFSVIFGRLAGLPSPDVPYPLLVFAGVMAWQFFASAFADASNSLVGNANMISKVYFPRMIVPLGSILVGLVDFAITAVLFAGLAIWFGYLPDWRVVFLPAFVALLFMFVFAAGVWVSALNVTYRDFRYLVPFAIQLGAYVSPVGFASSIVPEKWRLLYALNPMVGIIDGIRWSLLRGATPLDARSLVIACVVVGLLLFPGIIFFKRQERQFADVI